MRLFIILTLSILNHGYSQSLKHVGYSDKNFFKSNLELSSLVSVERNFYTATERKGMLLQLTLDADCKFKVANSYPLNIAQNAEIEGIAYYKGHLLLTDEGNSSVYDYDITNKIISTIEDKGFGNILGHNTGDFGMEGITIDEKNDKCFILKERTTDFSSLIHMFDISVNPENKIALKFLKSFKIQHGKLHQNPSKNIRYADIYFDSKSDSLYCLKTFYHDEINDNTVRTEEIYRTKLQYRIDVFSLKPYENQDGKLTLITPNNSYDRTKEVDDYRNSYVTNLEGITIYKDTIYLVSDNGRGQKPTLFLKMSLPKR
ncbi:MAG: esterase-like activity of phytase family protein [Flectobacillus sp.]|uniref:esterase-like activity of phytase family protein n=1 Tax=Flectobacillus sp. TaxID=50419 RepID=UPI003B9D2718